MTPDHLRTSPPFLAGRLVNVLDQAWQVAVNDGNTTKRGGPAERLTIWMSRPRSILTELVPRYYEIYKTKIDRSDHRWVTPTITKLVGEIGLLPEHWSEEERALFILGFHDRTRSTRNNGDTPGDAGEDAVTAAPTESQTV